MSSSKRTKIDVVILVAVLIVGYFGVRNALTLGDYAHLLVYRPSDEIRQLADDAGLNDYGKRIFYRYSPEFADAQQLKEICGPRIGCVDGRRIYILRGTSQAEYNTSVVTAAHEMLHVGYSRINQEQRDEIDIYVEQSLARTEYKRIAGKIFIYKDRPERYLNEGHSYIGTETDALQQELSSHYDQFFSDRSKVIRAHAASTEI